MTGLKSQHRKLKPMLAFLLAGALLLVLHVSTAAAYDFATAGEFKKSGSGMSGKTVTLDGKSLTIDQVVQVARHGAKVKLSNDARQRSLNAYYLLLEGAREGVPIYFFNRGTGSGRQVPHLHRRPAVDGRRPDADLPDHGRPVLQPGLPAPAAAAALPSGHAERLRPGGRGRGDRPRDDGRPREQHGLRGGDAAAHADPHRPPEQERHPGGAGARHPGRGRPPADDQRRGDDGGLGRRLLQGQAHAGHGRAQEGWDEAAAGAAGRSRSPRVRRSRPTTPPWSAPTPSPPGRPRCSSTTPAMR